jgi:hypothetical protein
VALRSSSRLVSRPMRRDSEDGPLSQMLTSIEDRGGDRGDRGNRGFWLQTARRPGPSAAVRGEVGAGRDRAAERRGSVEEGIEEEDG